MLNLLLVGIVILVVLAVLAALKLKTTAPVKPGAYFLKKTLFSAAERSFLGVMDPILPQGVRVFGKVGLDDVFGMVRGLSPSERQSALNRINRKHVDFLLVRANDLAPLAGIELDDSSHDAEDRQQRDVFVDEVFKGAGLPLLHVTAQKSYSQAEVKAKIVALLS